MSPNRRRLPHKIKQLPTRHTFLILNAVLLKERRVVDARPAENLHSDDGRLANQHGAESSVRRAIGIAGPADRVAGEAHVKAVAGVGDDGGSGRVVEEAGFSGCVG